MNSIGRASTRRKVAVLAAAIVVTLGTTVIGTRLFNSALAEREQVVEQETLATTVAAVHEAYMKPVPASEKLSGTPPDQYAEYTESAARYYGIGASDAAPADPAEVVGACMRERNLDLAVRLREVSTEALESRRQEIADMRTMIAKDCYERYSVDGLVPEAYTRDVHSH